MKSIGSMMVSVLGGLEMFGLGLLVAAPAMAQVLPAGSSSSIDEAGSTTQIVYETSGGLLASNNRLVIAESGRAVASLFNVIQGSRNVSGQLSPREMSLMQALFASARFDEMPARFVPEGYVIDGVAMRVTYAHDGGNHVVESETAAIEDAGFTLIREQLDGIVSDLLDQVVLRVTRQGGIVGRRQTLVVRASGDWDFSSEIPGRLVPPITSSGTFQASIVENLRRAAERDSLMEAPMCLSGAEGADLLRYEVTYTQDGASRTVQFSEASQDLPAILVAIRSAMSRLIDRLER